MKHKIFKRSVWTLLTIFFVLILALIVVLQQIAASYASWIDSFFNVTRYRLVNNDDGEQDDAQYFTSDYAVKDENGNLVLVTDDNGIKHQTYDNKAMRAHSMEVAEKVGEEGSVLLWNKNNALPIAEDAKVSLFGTAMTNWLLCGGGSGHVEPVMSTTFQSVLESKGPKVNSELVAATRLAAKGGTHVVDWNYALGGSYLNKITINETSWTALNSTRRGDMTESISANGDAAIFAISRYGAEDADILFKTDECYDGNYLDLSFEEASVLEGLQKLKSQGKIKKIVLIINSASAMSLKHINQFDIDACLWVGIGGNATHNYVTDLLLGKANPSGRLSDTWVYDVNSAPANANFGDFTFTESNGVPETYQHAHNSKYVVYQEGIYIGYRYYETRYEDLVIGGRNANSVAGSTKENSSGWNYGEEVSYSFGHGESYTTFEYSGFDVKKKGDNFEVSMTIKNTGTVAGKEVMQVYLQKPYTDYDRENKIEKSAVELVGFAKTKLLEPNEPQTLTVTVPEYEFKSYDANNKKTYILEEGDYYLAAGKNAHDALNNILACKGYSVSEGMDYDGNDGLTHKVNYKKSDYTKYSVSPFTNQTITNLFDNANINLYAGTAGQEITYLSRNNWGETYPQPVSLTCTSERMLKDMQYEQEFAEDPDAVMPAYNTVTSEYGRLSLIQLLGLPYDDPLWEDLLNQLTWADSNLLVTRGAAGIAGATSVNAPGFRSSDGPVGTGGTASGVEGPMAFTNNGLVASTFNEELVEELGNAFGMEIMHLGKTGIYGVGANIHRSAFAGRTFEYYSEDGFLTGKMNAAETRGLVNKGVVVFTKHFALNEQERNRYGTTTWANEQTIREIYLKAFEAGITEGKANGIMTSFNRIGCKWAGAHSGLINGVLKGEWGFTGMAETDAYAADAPYMSAFAAGVVAGQDVWMGGGNSAQFDSYKNNATVCQSIREACHRILYVQLNSAAMNGMTSNTHVEEIAPSWEIALIALEAVAAVLSAACLGMTICSWIFWNRDEREKSNVKN